MKSPLGIFAVHWDHEPTPNPSQEGNWHDVDECLLPSSEGSGVGRFMESVGAPRHYEMLESWILSTEVQNCGGCFHSNFKPL